jgi:pyruvate dehydrogenase E2 component (dihydrolipoamide acetyltransferase)
MRMAYKVIMPKAGMAMEEGTIMKWFKQEGDKVEAGEPLLEILTDKVSMEVEAENSGTLLKILKQEGEVVPVIQTIAYIGEAGEQINEEQASAATPKAEEKEKAEEKHESPRIKNEYGKIPATPLAKAIARKNGIDLADIKGLETGKVIKARDVESYVENYKEIKATPLASRIAKEMNLDMSQIKGSGFRGKITKEDLTAVGGNKKPETGISDNNTRKPMKGMRKIIADRMLKSHLEIPPVTFNIKADVTELLNLRKQINKTFESKITVNDFVMKAAIQALREHPYINVTIDGNDIVFLDEINLGMAVALPEGLIVPVIRNADKLSLRELSASAKDLGSRAKNNKLMPDEITGGTFSVSNLGMMGITSFTPIINQPESAILGVCAVEEVLRLENGRIESRSMMGLSLTADHRVIDGAQAAIFLSRIKELLENPVELIMDR